MSDTVERIMSRVGKTVRFKYPVNGKTITVKGVLRNRMAEISALGLINDRVS